MTTWNGLKIITTEFKQNGNGQSLNQIIVGNMGNRKWAIENDFMIKQNKITILTINNRVFETLNYNILYY